MTTLEICMGSRASPAPDVLHQVEAVAVAPGLWVTEAVLLDAANTNLLAGWWVVSHEGRPPGGLLPAGQPTTGHRRLRGAHPAMDLRDAEVVAWLEAGVPWSTAARQLRDAGIVPREVAGQYEVGVTLGLAFSRGEVTLDRVLELRRPARTEVSRG